MGPAGVPAAQGPPFVGRIPGVHAEVGARPRQDAQDGPVRRPRRDAREGRRLQFRQGAAPARTRGEAAGGGEAQGGRRAEGVLKARNRRKTAKHDARVRRTGLPVSSARVFFMQKQ